MPVTNAIPVELFAYAVTQELPDGTTELLECGQAGQEHMNKLFLKPHVTITVSYSGWDTPCVL